MSKQGYVVKKLMYGTKAPCFQTLGTVAGPHQFKRWTAALAFIVDLVGAKGAVSCLSDPDEPGCYDVFVDFGGEVQQYAIEGRG